MARTRKLSKDKNAGADSVEKLMEKLLEDVAGAVAIPFEEWHAMSTFPLVPLAIPVSQGRQYKVTQAGVNSASAITQRSWDAREDLRQTISREKFDKLSFQALGDTILSMGHTAAEPFNGVEGTDELGPVFFERMTASYNANLELLADQVRPDIDRHIPCHLFHHDQGVPAFSVGPVYFRPRSEWIDQFVIDPGEHALVRQVEQGELHIDTLRLRGDDQAGDEISRRALNVLRAMRGFSWIATIRMKGHELNQSHQKASILVGLAIDAIGLRFQVGDARLFTKAGRQHLYSEERLATSMKGTFLGGSSVQMPGLGARPGALRDKMANESPFLNAAGRILQSYVDGRNSGHAPHLVERWVNALYWIGEGRREASDFMAVVNYGCAADGLCGAGGSANTMTEFAVAALNPKGELKDDKALGIEEAVTRVYREGRNKLAHGEMPGLLEDLTEIRAIGDDLVAELFDAVTPVLADALVSDSPIMKVEEKHAYRALIAKLEQRP